MDLEEMTPEQEKYVIFLRDRPVDFAHMLGFNKLTELHNSWIIDMVTGKNDETLQASRGTYKTTCVSIALALSIILLPSLRTLFLRKTDADVKEIIAQTSKILRDPHTVYFVQKIYNINLRLTTGNSSEISTNLVNDVRGTSQLVGMGMGASITGKHFDRIFTDDIVNAQDRISRAERDATKRAYQELQNIKIRGGKIFNTGTPWHKDDAFTLMPNAVKYDCYNPQIRNIIITDDELADLKSKMAPSLFAANYELRHIASEDIIFTEPKTGASFELVKNGMDHVDAAYQGEDYTAYTAMNRVNGKYYIYGKLIRRNVMDCYGDIVAWHKSTLASKMYNEINGDKGYLGNDLRRLGIRVESYSEYENKYMKIVTYLKAIWNDVVFVEGTDPEYIDQICDYSEHAEHDDAPDSASCLARLLYNKKESYTPHIYG